MTTEVKEQITECPRCGSDDPAVRKTNSSAVESCYISKEQHHPFHDIPEPEEPEEPEYIGTASYSPDDNKLRMDAYSRLPKELYDRVRNAGFIWAPRQKIFVAPMWTPGREDLLLELCGEIGDEDKSLVERQEERAERFEDYSDNRRKDADAAHKAVHAIADHIPFGQPILVGHHSERHARRDAQKIQNGMRKAVKMWQTAEYWKRRAAGAIAHAKYKELPAVRHRRIKGLEADRRRQQKRMDEAEAYIQMWSHPDLTLERAKGIANYDHLTVYFTKDKYPTSTYEGAQSIWGGLDKGLLTPEAARDIALPSHHATIRHAKRWLEHIEHRLSYEAEMLGEAGDIPAKQFVLEVGGQVLTRHNEWVTILRVNRNNDGIVNSVSTTARYVSVIGIERIKDYRPPSEEQKATVKAAIKKDVICNYPGEGFRHITKDTWAKKHKDYKSTRMVPADEQHGRHRIRCGFFVGGSYESVAIYITDQKRVDPPAPDAKKEVVTLPPNERVGPAFPPVAAKRCRQPGEPLGPGCTHAVGEDCMICSKCGKCKETCDEANEVCDDCRLGEKITGMKDTLKAGVQVVAAPQLFPTPIDLAMRAVSLAGIEPGDRVLEPSAGTGNMLSEIVRYGQGATEIVAVEINLKLADLLRSKFAEYPIAIQCGDFLEQNGNFGQFDRIIMNPPFENGTDIKHILHARTMLKPDGLLVAICANGPRQQEKLQPLCDSWESLPDDQFKNAGTTVRTVLLTMGRTT